jgi:hypothetical protein
VGNGGIKLRFMFILCVGLLGAGLLTAVAFAANGHGSGNGNPSSGGQHGQDCAPGWHDTADGTCEHNGGGGGNCGDNQSGNDNGLGNDGNDNGFGHKGDNCDPAPSAPPPPPANTPPPSNPPGPSGPPAGGTPSAGAPSVTCATLLRLAKTRVAVGQRSLLAVHVVDRGGRPLRGARVSARGAGVHLSVTTDRSGKARFAIRALAAGAIRISVSGSAGCPSSSGLVLATAVTKAHHPDFTG